MLNNEEKKQENQIIKKEYNNIVNGKSFVSTSPKFAIFSKDDEIIEIGKF